MSLIFIPKGLIINKPTLIQVIACLTVDKSFSELMMLYFTDAYMHHSA